MESGVKGHAELCGPGGQAASEFSKGEMEAMTEAHQVFRRGGLRVRHSARQGEGWGHGKRTGVTQDVRWGDEVREEATFMLSWEQALENPGKWEMSREHLIL